jgi:glucose-1-phosphate adenylyltransferase
MGIYLFNWDVLGEMLEKTDFEDFGKEVIPLALKKKKVFGYFFDGYWEDIGTIRRFFEAHMELTASLPRFNFYDEEKPIFTHPRFLPGSKILSSQVNNSILCEGSILNRSVVSQSIIGIRTRIGENSRLHRAIIMGADFFESKEKLFENEIKGIPNMGIGNDCEIQNAIVDKNARIGHGVKLLNTNGVQEEMAENYVIRDGIIVIPKNAIIPNGTVI